MFCPPQPLRFWITPACAGKRCVPQRRRPAAWDHPRVCGEKFNLKEMSKTLLGSPPRMRGKGVVNVLVSEPFRIIPAYAGKSPALCGPPASSQDHPRVCGEKITDETIGVVIQGSPPRMRGKGNFHVVTHTKVGITPACAGKSWLRKRAPSTVWDHPRVCGEKTSLYPLKPILVGSPPRMRGKVINTNVPGHGLGITPACAGKRGHLRGLLFLSQDHPRACGEKKMAG